MSRRTTVRALMLLAVLLPLGCASPGVMSAHKAPPPTEFNGITATIKAPADTVLLDEPLRIEHTLANTGAKPVVLYELETNVLPSFERLGRVAGAPSATNPQIMLAPGESVTRWVELVRGEPNPDWPFSIIVRREGSGLTDALMTKAAPRALRFRVEYEATLFSGRRAPETVPVLATPWVDIQLEPKESARPPAPTDSH